jgi:dihydroxy-acid dehydratase
LRERARRWDDAVAANGGIHPDAPAVDTRVLKRFRATASPALRGAGVTND